MGSERVLVIALLHALFGEVFRLVYSPNRHTRQGEKRGIFAQTAAFVFFSTRSCLKRLTRDVLFRDSPSDGRCLLIGRDPRTSR